MNLFGFDAIKQQAELLAQSLVKQLPPKLLGKKLKVISINKISSVLEKIAEEGRNFIKDNKMGWLRRAYFANQFKWCLLAQGYEKEFIEMATEILIVEMHRKSKNAFPDKKNIQ